MRLFVVTLVMAVMASTQAMCVLDHGTNGKPEKRKLMRDVGGGYFRGAGGNCVMTPEDGPYKPDPDLDRRLRLFARPTISRGLWWQLARRQR